MRLDTQLRKIARSGVPSNVIDDIMNFAAIRLKQLDASGLASTYFAEFEPKCLDLLAFHIDSHVRSHYKEFEELLLRVPPNYLYL